MAVNQHAIDNARAWFESIREMVAAFDDAVSSETGEDQDVCRDRILESPLSVRVRSDWYEPHRLGDDDKPVEYEILLTTGGPTLRIIGDLNKYAEPTSAVLQWRDWGTSWTNASLTDLGCASPEKMCEADAILLSYANHFYPMRS